VSAQLRGRIINVDRDLSDAERASWASLAARAVEPNPFHEPACVAAAARHLPEGDRVKVAVVEDDTGFLACLPFQHVRSGSRHLPAVSYEIATSRVRRMNYLGIPLIDPTGGVEAMVKLLETLADECRRAGSYFAELWDVAAGGPADILLNDAAAILGLPLVTVDSFDRGILVRGDDTGIEWHNAKTMRELRRKQRRLERALGDPIVLLDRSDIQAIEEYIQLEASGYKSDTGVAMDMFAGEPEYFTEMCRSFAAEGRLHMFTLGSASRTAAMGGMIDAGGSAFMFKWSYDAEFAKHSPGWQLHEAIIDQFRTTGTAAMLDTCTGGHNGFVFSTYPSRRTMNRYHLVVHDKLRQRMWVRFVDETRGMRGRLSKLASLAHKPPQGYRAPGS